MGTFFLPFPPSFIHCHSQKENFLRPFPFFTGPLFLSYLGPNWRFCHVRGMLQGDSPSASPFALWRPPELLVEEAVQEKQDEWKASMEFEEDHMDVVRLVVNPHQLSGSEANPRQV